MVWFGDGHVHQVSRYNSSDRKVIDTQLDLMKASGGSGVRVTWQGPQYDFINKTAMIVCAACEQHDMLFSLIINPQVKTQANWWQDVGFQYMMSSPKYIPEKFICDFSTGIDYSTIPLPTGTQVLLNQQGFAWANSYPTAAQTGYASPTARTLSELRTVEQRDSMRWPFLTNGFSDAGFPVPAGVKPEAFRGDRDMAHSVWNQAQPARLIAHEGGNTFMDCVDILKLCPDAPYVSMVWNDSDEGAGVEHFFSAYAGVRVGV
jgi:hypothetical protein